MYSKAIPLKNKGVTKIATPKILSMKIQMILSQINNNYLNSNK